MPGSVLGSVPTNRPVSPSHIEAGVDARPLLSPLSTDLEDIARTKREDLWRKGACPKAFIIAVISLGLLLGAGFLITYFVRHAPPSPQPPKVGNWVLIISDIHLDEAYKAASDPDQACRAGTGNTGLVGDYRCDSSPSQMQGAIDELKQLGVDKHIDFVLWNGDAYPHREPTATQADVLKSISTVSKALRAAFPDTRIFPCIGNHDVFPINTLSAAPDNPYYAQLVNGPYADWFDTDTESSFLHGGRYDTLVKPGLRLISLNSMLWYRWNHAINMTALDPDPLGQFAWLSTTLTNAKSNHEKVMIVSHIGPGYGRQLLKYNSSVELVDFYNNKLLDTLKPHFESGMIVTSLFGHLHSDTLRLLDGGGVAMMTSAIDSFFFSNNPAVRVMELDALSHVPLSMEQYWMNLTLANAKGTPFWELLYSTRDAPYKLKDLSYTSWTKFVTDCIMVDSCFDETFLRQLVAGYPFDCNDYCRKRIRCSVTKPRYSDFHTCVGDMV